MLCLHPAWNLTAFSTCGPVSCLPVQLIIFRSRFPIKYSLTKFSYYIKTLYYDIANPTTPIISCVVKKLYISTSSLYTARVNKKLVHIRLGNF